MNRIAAATMLACTIFVGCDSAPVAEKPQPERPPNPALTELQTKTAEQPAEDYNAIAFRKARQGASAAMKYNWSTANTILDTIDIGRIDDTDTLAYVDYCKRCARVAQDIGVSTKSDPDSIADTAANLDFAQLAATAWNTVESKGWSGAAQLAADAKRIRDEIPMWKKLDAKLSARYVDE
jgi:hypothetical protein